MIHSSISAGARPFLALTKGCGRLLMLECYFDDSGTHRGSPVVVWGGLIGDAQSFVELEAAWLAQLAAPVPGKPKLNAFHLYDCVHAQREFEGYGQGAKDLARNLFRTIIINSGVAAVACGVDVNEWDRQVTGSLRAMVGSAERCAFGQCVKLSMEVSQAEGDERVWARFDAGRSDQVMSMVAAARLLYPETSKIWEHAFSPIAGSPSLQAADTIAYESYGLLRAYLDDPNAQPGPHLRHLASSAESTTIMLMGRDEIASLVEKMQPTVEQYQATGSLPSFENDDA